MSDENINDDDSIFEQEENNVRPYKNPLTGISKFNVDSSKKNSLIYISTAKYKVIKALEDIMKSEESESLSKSLSEDDIISIHTAIEGNSQTYSDDVLDNSDSDDNRVWDQSPEFDDKELKIRQVPINKNMKGSVTGKRAKLKFSNYLGIGGVTQIPLWHSGFWVSLKPIGETEIIDLDIRIGKSQIKLGRDTNGAVFSNASVIYDNILMDFIIDKISDTSLKLSDDDDLREYIKMQDFNTLILGLIRAVSPKGFGVLLACKNVVNTTIDDGISCNYTVTGKIDPENILHVDRNMLSKSQLKHMVKRSPNSVEVSDIKKYQEELPILKDKFIEIETSNNNKLGITLKTPNIQEHVLHGMEWVESTITMVEELMEDESGDESKSLKVDEMSKTTILNTYLHFFKSISTDDGVSVDSYDSISEILDLVVQDPFVYENLIKEVKVYIKENIMTMIGTPVYICPKCKEDQEVNTGTFKEIIPLNVISSFFDLGALRKIRLLERESTIY